MYRIDIKITDFSQGIIKGHISMVESLTYKILGKMAFENKPGSIEYTPADGFNSLPDLSETTWKHIGGYLSAWKSGREQCNEVYFWVMED